MLKPMKHMGHTRDLRHNTNKKINYCVFSKNKAQTHKVGDAFETKITGGWQ